MPIRIEGAQRVLRAQKAKRVKDGETIAAGLLACAQILFKKSQQLVPVDTGELKESGQVWQTGRGVGAEAFVMYTAPHAFIVHERMDVYHEPPTQARYLADAVVRVRGSMTARLKRQLSVGLK